MVSKMKKYPVLSNIDELLRNEPESQLAMALVYAAVCVERPSIIQHDTSFFWDNGADAWYLAEPDTDTGITVEFHGLTKKGHLRFRMFDTLYSHRKWFTVILPVNFWRFDHE